LKEPVAGPEAGKRSSIGFKWFFGFFVLMAVAGYLLWI
jgi:hypothetical protein